jgi:hypothetical protein
MSIFSDDLQKFEKYFDIEMEVSEITFGPIFTLISKFDDCTYTYQPTMIDIQDYPNDRGSASRIISELKSIIREYKINDLGI